MYIQRRAFKWTFNMEILLDWDLWTVNPPRWFAIYSIPARGLYHCDEILRIETVGKHNINEGPLTAWILHSNVIRWSSPPIKHSLWSQNRVSYITNFIYPPWGRVFVSYRWLNYNWYTIVRAHRFFCIHSRHGCLTLSLCCRGAVIDESIFLNVPIVWQCL